jgi:N-acyl-phosphatidylethanolamine-hydrolysing phospholipase D
MKFEFRHRLCALALCATTSAGSASDAGPGPSPPEPRPKGYQNNYIDFEPKGLGTLLQWRLQALRNGLPPAPREPVPVVNPDLAFIQTNARAGLAMQPAATWIGHASALVQMGGLNLLTDPIFSQRASPLSFVGPKRAQPPGLALAELPHIDLVLVSHNHYDHLDLASVRALNEQPHGPPLFVVPRGNKAWFQEAGIDNVVELDWWQSHRIGAVEVVLTPVQHWSGRTLTDRMATLWGGYALFAPDLHLFYSGDTGYSRDFVDIHERFAERHAAALGGGFDLALIAIGGYEPRWFMQDQHVNPAQAVQMHRDLHAKRSIGVHWGTFELTDDALDEAPRALAEARRVAGLHDDAFVVLPIGGTLRLPRRHGDTPAPERARLSSVGNAATP